MKERNTGGALSLWRGARKPMPAEPATPSAISLFLSGHESKVPAVAAAPAEPALVKKPAKRARVVFAIDATASRSQAWEAARKIQDRLFTAMPGELDVALAVHGGNRVHTFTPFLPDAKALRQLAADVRCKAGYTRLLDILSRSLESEGVRVVIYVGDVFEESRTKALRLADALKANETRVIILHDTWSDNDDGEMFHEIAARTGGAVLPFDHSSLERLGQLLEAVAVLAVGGVEAVQAKRESMPAAPLLLEHLGKAQRIGKRS